MAQLSEEELRGRLRAIFFKAAGGISDMANDEIASAMQLFRQYAEEREAKAYERGYNSGFVKAKRINTRYPKVAEQLRSIANTLEDDDARLTSPLPNTEKEE